MDKNNPGAVPAAWHEYKDGWHLADGEVIEEALITIYVNGAELATIMASPLQQDVFALGFMKNEGLIDDLSEVEILFVSELGCCVDVWLNREFEKPERVIITSGCGGGVTFDDPRVGIDPVESDTRLEPSRLREAFRRLQPPNSLYARSRGVHAAGLYDPLTDELLAIVEDVGRHNTIDKISGICLKEDIDPNGSILLVTGRISSEMLRKAAVMGCPIIASRTSPTSISVEMAQAWNITLIGYVRAGRMRVYSCPERVQSLEMVELIDIGITE
ncbi:MAG: formate dehydrogenase accessory sulfurtransferase FdhD [Anaerolineales bacterium]|nr:formate dehydrogenase accessory sulfurtransferase FdhD [Chloroflexota bacterium]MBL6980124.1 formate dehydrogenase accessory sulfurtransferase FdhD [Anaerolineales bacterium]